MEIFTNKDRVKTNLNSKKDSKDIEDIKEWVLNQKPTKDHTTHWWVSDLPNNLQNAFNRLANSDKFKEEVYKKFDKNTYDIVVESGMNEIYVAAFSHNKNSDTVFIQNILMDHWVFYLLLVFIEH